MAEEMKTVSRRCPTCRRAEVEWIQVPRYVGRYAYEGSVESVEVRNFKLRRCTDVACSATMLDDAGRQQLDDAARDQLGLLQPAQIVANRKRLGLSRCQLAEAIGIIEPMLELYESGCLTPRAIDRLLRKIFEYPEVRRAYGLEAADLRNETPSPTTAVA